LIKNNLFTFQLYTLRITPKNVTSLRCPSPRRTESLRQYSYKLCTDAEAVVNHLQSLS